MEQVVTIKEAKKEYEIIPSFNNDGETIENVIESAFLKYLKYNDYKWYKNLFFQHWVFL